MIESKKIIETSNAPKAIGAYSQGTMYEKFIFTSGQIPIDKNNNQIVSSDFRDQVCQTLNNLNQSLQHKVNVLADSINGMTLTNKILQQKLNEAMKHLSQSLEFYYSGNYLEALNQVDKALEIYPDLAISYARKGSIYYKMEDLNKATINWNIALQLDPEFGSVRDILLSIKNNKEDKKLPE